MEPANLDAVREALTYQGIRIGQHEGMLEEIMKTLQNLSMQVSHLSNQLHVSEPPLNITSENPSMSTAPTPAPVALAQSSLPHREPFVPPPEPYSGEIGNCSGFLLRCSLVFDLQPCSYPTDNAKIAYVINLLRGKAAKWATAVCEQESPALSSFSSFSAELCTVFDKPLQGQEASKRLLSLSQGSQSVADYSVDFRIVASESGWGERELKGVFLKSLSEEMKDELATKEEPGSLEEFILLAIRMDNRLRERNRERAQNRAARSRSLAPSAGQVKPPYQSTSQASSSAPSAAQEEPMQLGRAKLLPSEHQRRINQRLCIYCGQAGHFLASCPLTLKDQARQ